MTKASDIEAIRIYILPEKHGWRYRVDPPASLKDREKELPFYGEHGFWLKNQSELLNWIEEVARLKLQGRTQR